MGKLLRWLRILRAVLLVCMLGEWELMGRPEMLRRGELRSVTMGVCVRQGLRRLRRIIRRTARPPAICIWGRHRRASVSMLGRVSVPGRRRRPVLILLTERMGRILRPQWRQVVVMRRVLLIIIPIPR